MVNSAKKIAKNATALLNEPVNQRAYIEDRHNVIKPPPFNYGLNEKRFRSIDPAELIDPEPGEIRLQ